MLAAVHASCENDRCLIELGKRRGCETERGGEQAGGHTAILIFGIQSKANGEENCSSRAGKVSLRSLADEAGARPIGCSGRSVALPILPTSFSFTCWEVMASPSRCSM